MQLWSDHGQKDYNFLTSAQVEAYEKVWTGVHMAVNLNSPLQDQEDHCPESLPGYAIPNESEFEARIEPEFGEFDGQIHLIRL
jgi:hypothetical protein